MSANYITSGYQPREFPTEPVLWGYSLQRGKKTGSAFLNQRAMIKRQVIVVRIIVLNICQGSRRLVDPRVFHNLEYLLLQKNPQSRPD
jgi:hypothetical protein